MDETKFTCPYCGGLVPEQATVCPDCQEDLASLARLRFGPAILYNEALALAKEGHLDEARTKLLACLEQKESFAPGHSLLAKVHAAGAEWPQALRHVLRACQLRPDDAALAELRSGIEREERQATEQRQNELLVAQQTRASRVERYYQRYKQDMLGAFGVGVGAAAFLGLIIKWLSGGKRRA